MIEKCNFSNKYGVCVLIRSPCSDEKNCIIYQNYKNTIDHHTDVYRMFESMTKKLDDLYSNQKVLRKMLTDLKPKPRVSRTKTPKKKKPKSIKYNKQGQMRHPPTAMKTLLKQVKESDKK